MANTRETHTERDADGNVISSTETKIERAPKMGGFAPFLAVVLMAGAIGAYVYAQGSFENAGRQADNATAQVEQQVGAAAENAGDAIESAGDQIEERTDQAS